MNLKEIMMTVNSDITKPLNNLISDLSDEEIVLLNSVISKLDNTTYGLSALKTLIDGISTHSTEIATDTDSIISKLDNTTYGLSALKTVLNTVNTNAAYTKTNNTLLANTTYGLSALKTLIDGINSKVGSASGVDSYPNVTTGKLTKTNTSLNVTGKGKVTLYAQDGKEVRPSIVLDGVSLIDDSLFFYMKTSSLNSAGITGSPNVLTLTFESSLTVESNISTTNIYLYYILQTV